MTKEWMRLSITKETRRESYDEVLLNLGERQKQVYEYLKDYPSGITAKELAVKMHSNGAVHSPERNSVHPRLNELIDKGLVEVVGKTTCQYTNRKVAIYKTI